MGKCARAAEQRSRRRRVLKKKVVKHRKETKTINDVISDVSQMPVCEVNGNDLGSGS